MISMEALFWAPLGLDLLLLATTISCCKLSGMEWYLKTINEHSSAPKKNDDNVAKSINDDSSPIHSVWELAMIAYSAYGCLLPWAAYVCYTDPSHRVSCAWAMTTLMLSKMTSKAAWNWEDAAGKSKMLSLIVFYLPTYGGYAVYNTFLK